MQPYRFIAWLFGVGYLAMFVFANMALDQRDEARAFKAEIDGVELVCKAVGSDQ